MFEKFFIFVWIFHFGAVLVSGQLEDDKCSPTARPGETSVSVRKCDEYNYYACEPVLAANIGDTERRVLSCDKISQAFIVGGDEAKPHEFPHMAIIGIRHDTTIKWKCGGTLISEQFVVSAAHCFDDSDNLASYVVRLGAHDLSSDDEYNGIDLNIIESHPHPNYESEMQYNDIVLLKLERVVEFNEDVRPACLPEYSAVAKNTTTAAGWGVLEFGGDESVVLQKVDLDVFSQDECNATYGTDSKRNKGIVEKIQLCAGSFDSEKDTCQGDSGGPIFVQHVNYKCSYTIIGITSFGKSCGAAPGVYTRVYAFLDWIEGTVWPDE